MLFFIWKGKGYLVFLAVIADVLLTGLIAPALGLRDATLPTYIVEFIFAIVLFLPIWFYGKKWNANRRELIDKATGQEFVITNQNKVFWIPMQYWAIIYPALLLVIFAYSLISGTS